MSSSREEFISREISVVRDETTGRPVSFTWDGRTYIIREIIAVWPDWGFAAGAPRRKTWRMRRHRNYYRVETEDGEIFELYHDRGVKSERDAWILQSRVE
jgi:hypothetical protein